MRLFIGIVVGLFVAWNVAQPKFAKEVQDQAVEKFNQLCPASERREVTVPVGHKEFTIGCKTASAD